ncbi:MAG: hypothetical protein LBF38_08025 [Deltaproteobacteria bacterium]|nr:hypothetical protein [Deltaproteobacteria bacterium]
MIVLVGGGALGYYLYGQKKAEPTFKFVMDNVFGEGNYQYESVKYNVFTKNFVANALTFKATGLALKIGLTKIDRLAMAKPASQSDFEQAFGGKAAPDSILIEKLTIEGPEFAGLEDVLRKNVNQRDSVTLNVGSIELSNIKTTEKNILGILLPKNLQHVSFDTVRIVDLDSKLTAQKYDQTLSWEDLTLTLGNYEEVIKEYEHLFKYFNFRKIVSFSVSNFNIEHNQPSELFYVKINNESLEMKNLDFNSLESLILNNFSSNINARDIHKNVPLNLSINNLELKDFVNTKLFIDWAIDERKFYTDDFSKTPMKGSFTLNGLKADLKDNLGLSLKRLALAFDWNADQAPSSFNSTVEELSYLPGLNATENDLNRFNKFSINKLRQNELLYSFDLKTTYEPKTGNLTLTSAPLVEMKGFLGVDGSLTLNLAPDTLYKLVRCPLNQIRVNFSSSTTDWYEVLPCTLDTVFNKKPKIEVLEGELVFKNEKLMTLISAIADEFQISSINSEEIVKMLSFFVDDVTRKLSDPSDLNSQIGSALQKALDQGGQLTIKAQPPQPMSLYEFDSPPVFDVRKLNLSLTLNNEPTIYLSENGQARTRSEARTQDEKSSSGQTQKAPAKGDIGAGYQDRPATPTPPAGDGQAAKEDRPSSPVAPARERAPYSAEDYWAKFTFLMDSIFGQGNWEAGQARDYNASTGIYKVSPFSATLVNYKPNKNGTLKAASVEISSPLSNEELIDLNKRKLTDGQSELILDHLNFVLLKLELPQAVQRAEKFDVSVSSLALGPVYLSKYPNVDPEASFLSKLKISQAAMDNFSVASTLVISPDRRLALNLDLPTSTFEELALGKLVEAIKKSDDLLVNVEFKEGHAEEVRFLLSTNQDTYVSFRTGKLSFVGVKDLFFEIVEANDLNFTSKTFTADKKAVDRISLLKNLSLFAMDLGPLLKTPDETDVLGASILSRITPPISLSWGGVEGFEFETDAVKIGLESFRIEGPFTHLKVPELALADLKGLTLDFSDTDNTGVKFATQFLESEKFNLSANLRFVYEPDTGKVILTSKPLLGDPDLFNLTLDLTLEGLSQSLLAELSKISYDSRERALFMPGSDKLVLTDAVINLNNKTLAKNFFTSVTTRSQRPTAELVANLNNRVNSFIDDNLGQNLESKRLLASDLISFIRQPNSLDLTAKPNPPLMLNKVLAGTITRTDLNSLAINLTINNQSPVILRWTTDN